MKTFPSSFRPTKRARRSEGLTIVELVVSLPIILIAASMIATTILSSTRQRHVHSENALVADAIREKLEEMRNQDFEELFILYNEELFDDPLGPGTAPGKRFTIPGLKPVADAVDEAIGEILLPTMNAGGAIDAKWELREDIDASELGMPRDLNGDRIIDDLDHSGDYRLLPVCIIARWQSKLGTRQLRIHTLLAKWNQG